MAGIFCPTQRPSHVPSVVASLVLLLHISNVAAKIIVIDIDSNLTASRYTDQQARFGPDFPDNGLVGKLVYAKPDATACKAIDRPPAESNPTHVWIVLIARGGQCQFTDKVINAQNANYSAAIVHNHFQDDQIIPMGGDNGSAVTIPSTFVGYDAGMDLKDRYTYNSKRRSYNVKIKEQEEPDFRIYLWPFAIVVGVCFLMVMLFLIIKFVRDHTRARVSRLSRKHLKKIPIRKYKKGQYYDTCAICLDEYEDGEKIRVLPCDHAYHSKCIDPWLTRNKKTCPVCKRRVIPGKDPNSGSSESESEGEITIQERTPLLASASSNLSSYGNSDNSTSSRGVIPPVASILTETPANLRHLEEGGAVGGMGISVSASVEESCEQQEVKKARKERKSKRDNAHQAEVEDEESKEERRERRRRKRERKRQRTSETTKKQEGDHEERSCLLDPAESTGNPSDTVESDEICIIDSAGAAVDQSAGAGYINPSFSDSQDVVQPTGKKHEMNEVV